MTEATQRPDEAGAAAAEGASAGAMLRAAREKQGVHIAMLAATMKVTIKKLEALEADRINDLPDLAFARALAQAVCRSLKIDADPILARMPSLAKPEGLIRAANGLAAPYREPGDPIVDPGLFRFLRRPAFWATVFVLGAAAALAFAPSEWLSRVHPMRLLGQGAKSPEAVQASPSGRATRVVSEPLAPSTATGAAPAQTAQAPTAAPASDSAKEASAVMGPVKPEPTSAPMVEVVHSAPGAPGPAASMPEGASAAIVVRASAESWVEVVDGKGRSMIARTVQAGETVNIDGEAPFRVRLGNVTGTDLRYKG